MSEKALLTLLLSIASLVFVTGIPYLLQNYAYVNKIVDGDTVEVNYGERIRLAGLQTPEKGKPGYKAAGDKLKQIMGIPYVRIVRFPERTFGRTIAVLYTLNGKQINAAMRTLYKSKVYDRLLTKQQRAELEKGGWK